MRFLVEVQLPVETGNSSILDGSLMKKVQSDIQNIKPEATYFTVRNGQRTLYAVCNLSSEDQLVSALEPFWLDFRANINICPAMVPSDLEKAGPTLQKIAQSRSH